VAADGAGHVPDAIVERMAGRTSGLASIHAGARVEVWCNGYRCVHDCTVKRCAAGLTDGALGDILVQIAISVLTSYFNKAFTVDVDVPLVQPHDDPEVA
jgi:hypothetical protein